MKKTIGMFAISALLMATNLKAQVTPVDPSTFAGHYFTEVKMKPQKTSEINLSFDQSTGLLSGLKDGADEGGNKLKFHADVYNRKWASETGIWFWANDNNNGTYYGKEMFDYNQMTLATFIEPGVFVVFEAGKLSNNPKAFVAKMDPNRIRLMATDKSKLSMDKLVAVQKAEDMLNAAAGQQIAKIQSDQEKAAVAVPDETLSKTDKALKTEITTLLKTFMNPDDTDAEFVCAYTSSADWTIVRNNATGAILGREIIAEMILKNKKSGNCWRMPYTLTAPYNGSGYGKLAYKRKWDMIKVDCAQTAKNK